MHFWYFSIALLICITASSGCPSGADKTKKSDAKPSSESPKWSITFERIGGVAGFMDRLELTSDGKGQYFSKNEKKADLEMKAETVKRLEWVMSRKDLLDKAGEYKGGGKIMDDITYALTINKGDQTWQFKWEMQASHPKVFDEIRSVFDEILSEARNLAKSQGE